MRRWIQFRLSILLLAVVIVVQQATIIGMAVQFRSAEREYRQAMEIQQRTYRLLTERANQRAAVGEQPVVP